MAIKVLLPKFGQTVETSEITSWMVKEGSTVAKGDVLCEIATDKSSLEVESQATGTVLRILLNPGRSVPVGCVIALIGTPGEDLPESLIADCLATQMGATGESASAAPSAPVPAPAAAPAAHRQTSGAQATAVRGSPPGNATPSDGPPRRHIASPRARGLAQTRQVPLTLLSGTGDQGRVVEADVRDYLATAGPASPTSRSAAHAQGIDLRKVKGSGPDGRIMLADLSVPEAEPELPPLVARVERPSPMRRAIAANMTLSAQTIPAFQLEVTVEATAMVRRRAQAKAAGSAIGYGDLIAKAVAMAIRAHPVFAAAWTDEGIVYGDDAAIGFAVAVDGGLMVPVIHHCDRLTVEAIAAASRDLVVKARAGRLVPEEYQGGAFTLSNLGAFPVDRFVAIVPPRQSGILAIGRIRDEIVVRQGGFFPTQVLSLTLSADHRLIDGAIGAAFMAEVKGRLERVEA